MPNACVAADSMIGRVVCEFRVERLLAAGGMGAVYLARHVRLTNTLKVVKVMLPQYAADQALRQRFAREAEAASKLTQENILGIDNFGELEDGQMFLMTPYLDGEPLDVYLRKRGGRLPPHRALHIVVQLCVALTHAHERGVIHRDLKPGNVFLIPTEANPYMLKLLDFGIAKILGDESGGPATMVGIAVGTPGYMAPEQYERADAVGALADIYALCVMTWEIVSGEMPWTHSDYRMLRQLQQSKMPPLPPADIMPSQWAEILLSGMSVDPLARPRSARELASGLASVLPAVGLMPSGAEILASIAPQFVRKIEPGDETVRNVSNVDRLGPLLWPARETGAEALALVPPSTVELPHSEAMTSSPQGAVGPLPFSVRGTGAGRGALPLAGDEGVAPLAALAPVADEVGRASIGDDALQAPTLRSGRARTLTLGALATVASGTLVFFGASLSNCVDRRSRPVSNGSSLPIISPGIVNEAPAHIDAALTSQGESGRSGGGQLEPPSSRHEPNVAEAAVEGASTVEPRSSVPAPSPVERPRATPRNAPRSHTRNVQSRSGGDTEAPQHLRFNINDIVGEEE